MAIGQRRFIELAEQVPAWALVILDVARAAPEHLAAENAATPGADLRLGISQGDFKVSDEAAAMDLIMGVPWQAMRSVAMGMTSPGHDVRITAMLLQGLGISPAKAARVAAQPLPPLRDEDRAQGDVLARGLVSSGARSKKLAASPQTAAQLHQAALQRSQSRSAHRGDKGKPTSGD